MINTVGAPLTFHTARAFKKLRQQQQIEKKDKYYKNNITLILWKEETE